MVAALQWKNSSQPALSDIRTKQLMQAAQDGECDKINILVSGGLNVDCENVNGTTALMKAVSYGQAHAV
ncbi:MAG TPA: ankyrin repeat domain-containing protein, partial [Pyrinomonadaceae bacterium]